MGRRAGRDGGGGGGLSAVEPEPAWQSGVVPASIDPDDARALPDVSMDSGAAQEYDVFTSTLSGSSVSASAVGWLGDAGTSAASPIWAGLIAIADQGRALAGGTPLTGYTQTLPALYSLPAADFHDIVYGNNGDPAGPGYDLATGLGTPVANLLVPALAGYEIPSQMTIKTEPPSSVVAGSTFGLTVQVEDSLGNPVSGGTVTVALGNNPGDATLGGTLTAPVVERRRHLLRPDPEPARHRLHLDGDRQCHRRRPDDDRHHRHGGQQRHQGRRDGVARRAGLRPDGDARRHRQRRQPGHRRADRDRDLRGGIHHPGYGNTHRRRCPALDDPLGRRDRDDHGRLWRRRNDQPSSVEFPLTVGQAAATLGLSNLSFTYDGSPHTAVVTTSPGGTVGRHGHLFSERRGRRQPDAGRRLHGDGHPR